jgi:hypothetical protein
MARNNHDVPGNLTPILFTYQASGYHKMMVIAREHCSFPTSRRSPLFCKRAAQEGSVHPVIRRIFLDFPPLGMFSPEYCGDPI